MSATFDAAVPPTRRTVRARYPTRIVDVGRRPWRVRDKGGTGTALLFLLGSLGSADVVFRQMLALPPRLRCVAVDYPEAPTAR